MFHFNAQCLRNKFSDLADFTYDTDFDIYSISKNLFDQSNSDSEFTPEGYITF